MNTHTESKHTPGPWEWDSKPWDYDKEQDAPWLWGKGASRVLQGSISCSEADARLIAAAPELLEAAQKAQNAIQRVAGINDDNRLGWALKALDAAIAKATEGAQ